MGQLILIEKWAENLEEVTLSRWLKQEGDVVKEGDSLCEIITDKVTFEYEIEIPGTVRCIYCPEKSVLPVGYAVAFIGEQDECLPGGIEKRNRELLQEHAAKAALELDLSAGADNGETQARQRPRVEPRVRATPAARRVARENDVTIELVAKWLKHEGAVTEADVEAYVEDMEDGLD